MFCSSQDDQCKSSIWCSAKSRTIRGRRAKLSQHGLKRTSCVSCSPKTAQVLPAHAKHRRPAPKKSNLGEFAIQEARNDFALIDPPPTGVLLFKDHKIARTSFLCCRTIAARLIHVHSLYSENKKDRNSRRRKSNVKQY